MTSPRPDQRHGHTHAGAAGSRSGSGDLAGALGYPGVPPAVPNCLSAQALRRAVGGGGTFFTFTAPGRIWTVLLAYDVVSTTGFTAPARFAAFVQTVGSGLTLAIIGLALASTSDKDSGTIAVPYNGLPVVGGESLTLGINGGTTVAGVQQEASAVVLYSIP